MTAQETREGIKSCIESLNKKAAREMYGPSTFRDIGESRRTFADDLYQNENRMAIIMAPHAMGMIEVKLSGEEVLLLAFFNGYSGRVTYTLPEKDKYEDLEAEAVDYIISNVHGFAGDLLIYPPIGVTTTQVLSELFMLGERFREYVTDTIALKKMEL